MNVFCPKCGQEYEIEESFIGQNVECQKCGEKWTIRPPEPRHEAEKTKKCPMCGEEILAVAQKCRFCGEYLTKDGKVYQRKNRTIYILLGLFFGHIGAHNFYAGQYPAAIIKLVFFVLTTVVFAICAPHEPAWIAPAILNTYFVIFDLFFRSEYFNQRKKADLRNFPVAIQHCSFGYYICYNSFFDL